MALIGSTEALPLQPLPLGSGGGTYRHPPGSPSPDKTAVQADASGPRAAEKRVPWGDRGVVATPSPPTLGSIPRTPLLGDTQGTAGFCQPLTLMFPFVSRRMFSSFRSL